MASAKTIAHLANDAIDLLEAIKRRSVLADYEAKGANRQANRLGTSVSGSRGTDVDTYSNPTAEEAFRVLDRLERTESELGDVKHALYHIADFLAEWAPNRVNDGKRRCGKADCARVHFALGLCEPHYRQQRRAEQRQRAIDAAKAAEETTDDTR